MGSTELGRLAEAQSHSYHAARPFPYVVVDGLMDEAVLDELSEEFPAPDHPGWQRHDDRRQRKLQGHRSELHGPTTRCVLHELMSAEFLGFLEQLTGVEGLIGDPWLESCGLHQVEPGGFLKVHSDLTFHPHLRLARRVNLILYLNRDWPPSYGAPLEFWDAEAKVCVQRIEPIWGRMVIFSCDAPALHGHPEPVACPAGMTRRSLAVSYNTVPADVSRFGPRPADRWPGRGDRWLVTRNYLAEMLPPSVVSRISRWHHGRDQDQA